MFLRICGSSKFAKGNWVLKSQICKPQKRLGLQVEFLQMPHLQNGRKFNKFW
jgi:hypothetical protein